MVDLPDELELSDPQTRVLGALLEKQATTPDAYPLTLKALTTACNQTTSRDPVVDYDANLVETTCQALKAKGLLRIVHPASGERATKYRQILDEQLGLDAAEKALVAVLLLRGGQTVPELKSRTDRMHAFSGIDEVEAVHVSRDRAQRRASDLDRPAEREFWRHVVSSSAWEVEIATLRLDGRLAAYVVALLDGNAYRVFDGRMSTDFQDYSPGRIIESAALDRALAEPRFTILDWMSGVAAEKLLVANVAEGRARLLATSGSKAFARGRRSAAALAKG